MSKLCRNDADFRQAGPVLLLVSVVWLGGTYTFDMPQVAATFSIGIALIIALVFWGL